MIAAPATPTVTAPLALSIDATAALSLAYAIAPDPAPPVARFVNTGSPTRLSTGPTDAKAIDCGAGPTLIVHVALAARCPASAGLVAVITVEPAPTMVTWPLAPSTVATAVLLLE